MVKACALFQGPPSEQSFCTAIMTILSLFLQQMQPLCSGLGRLQSLTVTSPDVGQIFICPQQIGSTKHRTCSTAAWLVRIRRRPRYEYCLSGYIRRLRVWPDAWQGDGVISWADVAVGLQLMKPAVDGHRQERNL